MKKKEGVNNLLTQWKEKMIFYMKGEETDQLSQKIMNKRYIIL